VTVALLIVMLLPWLYSVIESAKLPGGYEVKFRDISEAAKKIEGSGDTFSLNAAADAPTISELVYALDPNLAMAYLRIEVEKSVRAIARKNGFTADDTLSAQIRSLTKAGVFPPQMADGILSLIGMANRAIHGASVDPMAAEWAVEHGEMVINSLRRFH